MTAAVADPSSWRLRPLPDLNDVAMWPDADWHKRVDDWPVDHQRTQAFRLQGDRIRTAPDDARDGANWDVPWQRVDVEPHARVRVWESSAPPVTKRVKHSWWIFSWYVNEIVEAWPYREVPLPNISAPGGQYVRRLGDPNPAATDCQAFVVDPNDRRYYELSSARPSVWPTPGTRPWTAGRIAVWDLNRPWWSQTEDGHPVGITGSRIPMLPLIPRADEYRRGRIDHALHLAGVRVKKGPDAFVGIARATDGKDPDGVLREGDRGRITAEARARLEREYPGEHNRIWLRAMFEHGFICCDITDERAGDQIRTAQDPGIELTIPQISRSDVELLKVA